MNRIILIGNGFDLAHNLKTSYRDFIDDFWVDFANRIANYEGTSHIDGTVVIEASGIKITHPSHVSLHDFHQIKTASEFFTVLKERRWISFQLNNRFLSVISNLFTAEKWVDIEEAYYKELRKLALEKDPNADAIRTLNKELTEVENWLCAYLNKELSNKTETNNSIQKICNKKSGINVKELSIPYNQKIKEELKQCFKTGSEYRWDETVQIISSTNILWATNKQHRLYYFDEFDAKTFNWDKIIDDFQIKHRIQDNLFLNFNYTLTPKQYAYIDNGDKIINIHGTLNDENNPIIFGYGDEAGEDYAKLENTNVDEVLKKIKSQHYLLNGSYRELMNFMESDVYQVVILGHSCGNSDRTLLKALFEHENCVSIKPYYYTNKEGVDNYGDITRAISRNFSDKTLMRSKVVDKTLCSDILGEK